MVLLSVKQQHRLPHKVVNSSSLMIFRRSWKFLVDPALSKKLGEMTTKIALNTMILYIYKKYHLVSFIKKEWNKIQKTLSSKCFYFKVGNPTLKIGGNDDMEKLNRNRDIDFEPIDTWWGWIFNIYYVKR